ncbi:hypothetical protein DYB37_012509 [Aphanomyces astaci]|uniref:Uncharacterized protein n=1 Tax=Aphanomyces astaci TaxID=112090 RepID=A0A3R7CP30_APHAT|nr:hypothetical protein DYB37_012509 [Aphanomyces astaci]
MAANPKDTVGINLLVFNGKKDKFRVWTAKFVSHLKEMTAALQVASTTPDRPEPTINFEDWLQGDPPVATDPDEKRAKWHQYYRTMQVQQIRTLLSKVVPDQFVQQMKESYSEKEPIYRLWAEIEKKYGVSNVTTMKTATRKLMRVADGDFQSVEALFGELRTLKHSINSHFRWAKVGANRGTSKATLVDRWRTQMYDGGPPSLPSREGLEDFPQHAPVEWLQWKRIHMEWQTAVHEQPHRKGLHQGTQVNRDPF